MPPPQLDHIVILLPHADLLNPPAWLTKHFTISPGGRHADNRTENKLILFQDGSYIELIAFIDDDPARRAGHWWGDASPGIIDFALTTPADPTAHFAALQARLAKLAASSSAPAPAPASPASSAPPTGPDASPSAPSTTGPDTPLLLLPHPILYAPPAPGSRTHPTGAHIAWRVTSPRRVPRGLLPFFCHDTTPRALRVPLSPPPTTHPCRACGLKGLVLRVAPRQVAAVARAYAAVLDVRGEAGAGAEAGQEAPVAWFRLGSVHAVAGMPGPVVWVQGPEDRAQEAAVAGRGFVLGDLQVGGVGALASGFVVRIDGGEAGDMGRVFLDLEVPVGGAEG